MSAANHLLHNNLGAPLKTNRFFGAADTLSIPEPHLLNQYEEKNRLPYRTPLPGPTGKITIKIAHYFRTLKSSILAL